MTTTCPICGGPPHVDGTHSAPPMPPPCDHTSDPADPCHRSPHLPCPFHFGEVSTAAMNAVRTLRLDKAYADALLHLIRDRYLVPAFYTWLAMTGRWGVPEGGDRHEVARLISERVYELQAVPGAPVGRPLEVSRDATVAAILGDGVKVEAVLDVAEQQLPPLETSALFSSIALGASLNMGFHRGATKMMVQAHHLVGAHCGTGHGFTALPYVIDAVCGQALDLDKGVIDGIKGLAKDHDYRVMVSAVDLVCRALGQVMESRTVTLAGSGPLSAAGLPADLSVFDWRTADPATTERSTMAVAWALRCAEAYGGADDEDDMRRRFAAVAEQHGEPATDMLSDVLLGGTYCLGQVLRNAYPDGDGGHVYGG